MAKDPKGATANPKADTNTHLPAKQRTVAKTYDVVDMTDVDFCIRSPGFWVVTDLPLGFPYLVREIQKMIIDGPFKTEEDARSRVEQGFSESDVRLAEEITEGVVGFVTDPDHADDLDRPENESAKRLVMMMMRASAICSGELYLCDECRARVSTDESENN